MSAIVDDWIVDEVKDALRRSKTHAELTATANHFTRDVVAMQKSRNQGDRTMAIQIRNLLIYRRASLRAGCG